MKNFDLKSAVIGLLLGVCVMLIVGAGGNGSSEVGRYRMMPLGYPSNICVEAISQPNFLQNYKLAPAHDLCHNCYRKETFRWQRNAGS
jgi:hypothetical protein